MDSLDPAPRKRFFKPRIQNRLLLAFVAVAVVPMTLALWAVVQLNARVLEHDIVAKLETASLTTGELIARVQDAAFDSATGLAGNPEFPARVEGKGPVPFEVPERDDGISLIGLWLPDPAPGVAAASDVPALPASGVRTLMLTQVKDRETLMAGAVVPVERDGVRVGQLAVGLPLGKSFAQDIEIHTGVVARIYHEKAPPRLVRIFFELDSTELTPDGLERVGHIAHVLRRRPQVGVILEGRTDDTGDARHNYHLSERRTKSIAVALGTLGIPRWRISHRNYGEAWPLSENTTPEGRAMNRSVEVQFTFDENEVMNVEDLPITAEARDVLFAQGQPYYDRRASLRGDPYRALYRPLVSRNGRVLGMLFLGVPQKYTFGATVATWRFYPVWMALGVFLALILGYGVSRSISRPLRRFVAGVRDVADGNIDQHMEILSRDELGDLASAFNDMTQELRHLREREADFRRRDRLAALGEMAAGIAHEVRNPLNIMRNAAQRLVRRSDAAGGEQQEMSRFIVEEVDRLERVVSQLLAFARQPQPEPQPTDANALIDRTLAALAPEAAAAGVDVELELEDALPPVMLDPEQGYRVLMNLAQNAFQQMGPNGGGRLTVRTRAATMGEARRGAVRIEVADTGPGIAADAIDRVFNPFYTTREDGVGLGLSLVHNIITAHGGDITVESTPGRGATFQITLPQAGAARPAAPDGATPAPPADPAPEQPDPALQTTP